MEVAVFYDTKEFAKLQEAFKNSPDIFGKAVRAALRRAGANMGKGVRDKTRAVSYLKMRAIVSALGKLKVFDNEAMFTIAGAKKYGHDFKLAPNRITARKGKPSIKWPSPGVNIGPGEPLRYPHKAGFSKPFIARYGEKGLFWREKSTGKLSMPPIVSPQYFAMFDEVQEPVLNEAEKTFLKRLEHEVDYRLGLK